MARDASVGVTELLLLREGGGQDPFLRIASAPPWSRERLGRDGRPLRRRRACCPSALSTGRAAARCPQGCTRRLVASFLVDLLKIGVAVSSASVGAYVCGCDDWRLYEEVVPVLLPSGGHAQAGVGTTIPARLGRRPEAFVLDTGLAFLETCEWAVQASAVLGWATTPGCWSRRGRTLLAMGKRPWTRPC